MKVVKGKEIILSAENEVGKLEEIARIVKDSGINIRAISGWHVEDKAFIRLAALDNSKISEVLRPLGTLEEKDIVIVEMPDEVGQLHALAEKLKGANIDLEYIYGTTSEPGKGAVVIFSSNDNDKALEVLSA